MVVRAHNIPVELVYIFLLVFHDLLDRVLKFSRDQILLSDLYLELQQLFILGAGHFLHLGELLLEKLPQVLGILAAAVDQHDVHGLHFLDEFGCLPAVGVCGETDILDCQFGLYLLVFRHAGQRVCLLEVAGD